MFKIKKNPSFWTKVTVQLEGEEPQDFEALFKIKPISEIDQLDLAEGKAITDLLKEVTVDFRGFEITENPDAAFQDCLKVALDYAYIRNALFRAYVAGSSGAIRGN